jgi:ribonuclease J
VPENGQLIRLAPGRAGVIDEVPSGRVHMDGRVLIEEGMGLARHRRALSFAGMIAITVVLDGKGRLAADPVVIADGIPDPVQDAVRNALAEPIRRHNPRRDGDGHDLKENLRRAARRAAEDAWGKKPVTKVEVVQL